MKSAFVFSVFFLLTFVFYAQNKDSLSFKIDTLYTIDSLWRNDTLFIIKTKRIIYKTNEKPISIDTITLLNSLPKYDDLISYGLVSLRPHYELKIRKSFFDGIFISFSSYFYKPYYRTNYDLNLPGSSYFVVSSGFSSNLELFKGKNILSTGLISSEFIEHYSFFDNWKTVDSSIFYEIQDVSYWNVDTVRYLDLDSLLNGDTVWHYYYDSSYVVDYDTIEHIDYDTTQNKADYNRLNKYSYVEIPLIYRFYDRKGKFTYGFGIGVIASILTDFDYLRAKSSGQGFYSYIFAKNNFSLYTSFDFGYIIDNTAQIKISFYNRLPLKYTYQTLGMKFKVGSFGISFGVSYRIR